MTGFSHCSLNSVCSTSPCCNWLKLTEVGLLMQICNWATVIIFGGYGTGQGAPACTGTNTQPCGCSSRTPTQFQSSECRSFWIMSVSRHFAFRLCLSPIKDSWTGSSETTTDHCTALHHSDWVTKAYHIKMMIFIRFIIGSFSRYWWVHNWHPQLLHWADLLQPSGRLQVSLLWLPSTLQESVKHVSQIYIFSPAKVLHFWLRVRFLLYQSMPRLRLIGYYNVSIFELSL